MADIVVSGRPSYSALPRVVSAINGEKCVVNKGAADGLSTGDRFLVFSLGDEIVDPETGESLGKLEIVRGRAQVVHLQDRMATLQTIEKETRGRRRIINKNNPFMASMMGEEIIEDAETFLADIDAEVGDFARPI